LLRRSPLVFVVAIRVLTRRGCDRDREEDDVTNFKLDMSMMFAIHDALRRDLEHVARIEARSEGWDLFDRMLHMHHGIEDDLLWPVVRDAVSGQSGHLALLDEMASEHAALLPPLEMLDRALTNGEAAAPAAADLDRLLREHLTHEERAALPLVDQTLTEEQWMAFGQASVQRVGADMPQYLPWVLDGVDAETTAHLLGVIPPPVRQTYEDEWRPAYAAVDKWATKSSVS
jgi:hypothetical protein